MVEETNDVPSLTYWSEKGLQKKVAISDVISDNDTWVTNKGVRIIKYDGCQKIFNYCNLKISIPSELLCQPSKENKYQHIFRVNMGYLWDKDNKIGSEGIGEASVLNTGRLEKNKEGGHSYVEFGEIDAMYKAKMAYKRAYVEALFKLLQITGVYSDVEAKAFEKVEAGLVDYKTL